MPNLCMQGEQVGIRVTVFNYMEDAMEATVVLHGSPDYKFVHVEENGIVRSYNPRTSFGEHQFFIYIKVDIFVKNTKQFNFGGLFILS